MKSQRINRNTGIRCPIKNSNFQDVNVISFSIERNHSESQAFSASNFPYYTFNYIVSGAGWATYNGNRYKLLHDMLYVVFPNTDSTIVQDEKDPYTLAWFVCDGTKVKRIVHRLGIDENNLILQLKPDERLRKIFSQTPMKCKNGISKSDIAALSSFYQIIDLILDQTECNVTESSKASLLVEAATQYVKDNCKNPDLTVKKVGEVIGVTPKHLSTVFKRETGNELGKFITNCKLSEATELMRTQKYSVSEIAQICGFSSPYYFSSVYKKYNLISPSLAMKEYKK